MRRLHPPQLLGAEAVAAAGLWSHGNTIFRHQAQVAWLRLAWAAPSDQGDAPDDRVQCRRLS